MESFQYNIIDIAAIISEKMKDKYDEDVSYWKLQKLLYFAQGFTMAYTDKKLFNDFITLNGFDISFDDVVPHYSADMAVKKSVKMNNYIDELLENLIEALGDLKLNELEEMIYREELLMENVRYKNKYIITDEVIKNRFKTIIKKVSD